jgi:hypothetical protein
VRTDCFPLPAEEFRHQSESETAVLGWKSLDRKVGPNTAIERKIVLFPGAKIEVLSRLP